MWGVCGVLAVVLGVVWGGVWGVVCWVGWFEVIGCCSLRRERLLMAPAETIVL